MKHNLLLLGGVACIAIGFGLFSIALGILALGASMVAVSFAFIEPGPAPEDRHIERPDLEQ